MKFISITIRSLCILFAYFCFTSCVKDLDFDQAENIEIKPVFEASLVYFNYDSNGISNVINTGNLTLRDTIDLIIFNDQFLNDNLAKTEMTFEMTNTFPRGFEAQMIFADLGFAPQLPTVSIMVPPSPDGSEQTASTTVTYEGVDLVALKQSTQVLANIIIENGAPIDPNSNGRVRLRSKATFYIEIQ